MATVIAPVIRQHLSSRALARLEAALAFSPVYRCVKCWKPGDDRVDETTLITVLDDRETATQHEHAQHRRIHARCGTAAVLTNDEATGLTEDVTNSGHSPRGAWCGVWLPASGPLARRPGFLIEQGVIDIEVYDVPGDRPIAADGSARLLRQEGFRFPRSRLTAGRRHRPDRARLGPAPTRRPSHRHHRRRRNHRMDER